MTDQAPSHLSYWVVAPLYRLVPNWIKAMFLGVPWSRRVTFKESSETKSKPDGRSFLPLMLISEPSFSGSVKHKGIIDAVIPQSLFLRREVTAPKSASGSLHSVAKLDLQRKTPFTPADVYWSLGQPKRSSSDIVVDQWIAKRTDVSEWKSRMSAVGLRLRRVFIDGAEHIGPVVDFSHEVASARKAWRWFNGLMGCAIVAFVAVIWLYPAWSIGPDLQRMDEQKAKLTAEAISLRSEIRSLGDQETEKAAFLSLVSRGALLSDTLTELTTALEDGVWLKSIEYRPDKVLISGETIGSAPGLVLKLSSNKYFTNPGLSGPVSKTATGAERFEIELIPGGVK